jgi:hypothetical protein
MKPFPENEMLSHLIEQRRAMPMETEQADHESIEIDDKDFEAPASKAKESSTVQKKLNNVKQASTNQSLEKIIYFAENGFSHCCQNHSDIVKMGYALAHEFEAEGENLFLFFAESYTSQDWGVVEKEYRDKYAYIITKCDESATQVKIGTIFWLFRQFDAVLFASVNREWSTKHIDMFNGIRTTGIVADYFKQLYGDKVVTVNKVTYMYNGIRWVAGDETNTQLILFVDTEFYKELIKIGEIQMKTLMELMALETDKKSQALIQKEIEEVGK